MEYVICIRNEDLPASLEIRRRYLIVPDPEAEQAGMIRVIDESGEDYLYPRSWFVPISDLRSPPQGFSI